METMEGEKTKKSAIYCKIKKTNKKNRRNALITYSFSKGVQKKKNTHTHAHTHRCTHSLCSIYLRLSASCKYSKKKKKVDQALIPQKAIKNEWT